MADFCDCGTGLDNTGKPKFGCLPIMAVTTRQIIMSTYASDGTLNFIPDAQVLDQTYLDGKINEALWQDRWFIVDKYQNVEDVTGDPKTEEFPSGISVIVQDGVTSFKGFLTGDDSILYPRLKSYGCASISVFNIDKTGNIAYHKLDDSGDKYPLLIADNTFWTRPIKATDETIPKAEVNFQYDQSRNDANNDVLFATDITADLANAGGLLNVNGEITTTATTTEVSLLLTTDYQTVITGLLTADFECFNVTTQLAVTITSATENPVASGIYDIVLSAAQASAILEFDVVKLGFDGDSLKELEVPTP